MSARYGAPLIAGKAVYGVTSLGVLGSVINATTATGDNGPGYLYNDVAMPADANAQVWGRILTWPTAGSLFAYEDGSFSFTGAPDGSYSFTYQPAFDGVDVGSARTVTLLVGEGEGARTGASSLVLGVVASAAIGVAPSTGAAAITLGSVGAAATGTVTEPGAIVGSSALIFSPFIAIATGRVSTSGSSSISLSDITSGEFRQVARLYPLAGKTQTYPLGH